MKRYLNIGMFGVFFFFLFLQACAFHDIKVEIPSKINVRYAIPQRSVAVYNNTSASIALFVNGSRFENVFEPGSSLLIRPAYYGSYEVVGRALGLNGIFVFSQPKSIYVSDYNSNLSIFLTDQDFFVPLTPYK